MRLADEFYLAITDAIDAVAQEKGADLNAVLGALVSAQARFIGGIDHRASRRAALKAVLDGLPAEVSRRSKMGDTARTAVLRQNGRPN